MKIKELNEKIYNLNEDEDNNVESENELDDIEENNIDIKSEEEENESNNDKVISIKKRKNKKLSPKKEYFNFK